MGFNKMIGDPELDRDLQDFLSFLDCRNTQKKIKSVSLEEGNIIERLFEILPSNVIRLGHFLYLTSAEDLTQQFNGDTCKSVLNAKSICDEYMADIFSHPELLAYLEEDAEDRLFLSSGSLHAEYNIPDVIQHQHSIRIENQCIVGQTRLAFLDRSRDRVLYDATLNIGELAFIVRAMTKLLKDNMKITNSIAQLTNYSTYYPIMLDQRIEKAKAHIEKMEKYSAIVKDREQL